MMLRLLLLLMAFGCFAQCRKMSSASDALGHAAHIEDLIAIDHHVYEHISHALEGQRLCLVALKSSETGPHFLMYTPERVGNISWLEKGCLQERDTKAIPARMKLYLWAGRSFQFDQPDMIVPIGQKGVEVVTDLVGLVGGVKVTVGMLKQQKILNGERVSRAYVSRLTSICQFGKERVEVYGAHCKLLATPPYKNLSETSLKLVAPH